MKLLNGNTESHYVIGNGSILCNSRPINSFGTESDRTYLYTVQSAHHISWGSLSDLRSVHCVLVTAQCTQRVNLLFQISENKWKTSRYKWQDHTFLSVSSPEFGMTARAWFLRSSNPLIVVYLYSLTSQYYWDASLFSA